MPSLIEIGQVFRAGGRTDMAKLTGGFELLFKFA
jgi:hypothetical protein